MQETLQQLKDQKLALDQSAIVAQTDSRGIITMVNDKFCEISGYSRDELIGQDHRLINSGQHPRSFFLEMWRTISAGQIWRGEVCNRKKSGELYWVSTTITPFCDETGRPYQYLAIRQDISELKRLQQTLVEQQAQMVNASRLSAIGEMAAAITHEINNPLGVILGRAEMIMALSRRGQLEAANLERLAETILITGRRIEKIVRSMKSLSHKGTEDEALTPYPVAEIVADSLELCTQRFREGGIRLIAPIVEPGLRVDCRSYEIVQILVNLLNNAYDAVVALDERWVELAVKVDGPNLEFSVTDSGAGVPAEVQSKLFQPFFSTKRVQYGTGLGLSISRGIIERHGGRLVYDQDSPHTRFVVRLPLKRSV